jgi:DNA-binding transcriptional MerR regulator
MSQPSDEMLTIGAFSKRSRLSLKALRLYDEMALLRPAAVDPQNGYRYYGQDQLELARLIGFLRSLEMPLAQIAEVISLDGMAAVKSIGTYWQGVEADVRTKRKLVRYLVRYLSGKGVHMFAIETRQIPDQQVAAIERRVLVGALPQFIGEAMGLVYDALGQAGAETGIPLVVYHGEVNTDSDGPVEVCVPYVGDVKATGEIRLRLEPGHTEAFTRITKAQVAFPGILEAYEAVEKWAADNDRPAIGSPREVYFTDWDAAGDEDPACDIALPVKA